MRRSVRFLALVTAITLLCVPVAMAQDNPLAEKVDINWLGYYTSEITVGENTPVEQYLEERFNVNINPITDVSKSAFGLYVVGLGVLDATFYTVYLDTPDNIYNMYDQGLIREIPNEWLYTYYPTGMKYLTDYLGEEYFEKGNHLTKGHLLNVPYIRTENNSQSIIVYRQDWLDNLGMEIPATLDEFHDMLYAFTYNDPDQNGLQDTYGMNASTAWMGMWMVYGAHGIAQSQATKSGSFYLNDDGTVTYTSVTDAYRQSLDIIAKWYQEGILDPECITDARSDIRTKWSNGSIGSMVDSFTWGLSKRSSSSIINMVDEVYGEGSVGILGKLTCETGDGNVYATVNYSETNLNQSIIFTSSATDEQVIRTLQILEGCSSDSEMYKRVIYGEEGVDYTIVDGTQIVNNGDVSVEYQAAKGLGGTFYGLAVESPELTYVTYSLGDRENLAKAEESPVIFRNSNFTSVPNGAYSTYFEEVKKVEDEYYTDVLLGRQNTADDWNTYVDRIGRAGLDKILAEYVQLLAQ